MTTIAYRNGVMVADGLMTQFETAYPVPAPKIVEWQVPNGGTALFGCSGQYGLTIKLRTQVANHIGTHSVAAMDRFKTDIDDVDAILAVQREGKVTLYRFILPSLVKIAEPFAAIGSGARFALGAMAAGAGPRQAVEIAKQFDIYTGGEIVTLSALPHNQVPGDIQ